jgi:hypothetical protein
VNYLHGGGHDAETARREAVARADEAVQAMQKTFFATPYRPTGLTTEARAAIRLIDELRWLNSIVLRSAPTPQAMRPDPQVWAVKLAAADVLATVAEVLEDPRRQSDRLVASVGRMHAAVEDLERSTVNLLPVRTEESIAGARTVVSSLDPSFRAQELSFIVAQIATNTEFAAGGAPPAGGGPRRRGHSTPMAPKTFFDRLVPRFWRQTRVTPALHATY